jgi:asparagine synthetase B (glutamine-hydrolysing)
MESQRLIAARAPGSLQAIYFVTKTGILWISDDLPTLIRQAGISSAPDRLSIAGHFAGIWPAAHRTYFEQVRRVPPAQALVWSAGEFHFETCWDPFPSGRAVDWIGPDALDQFEGLFETAVLESLGEQPTGVFLSGGLDSVSVTALARDLSQRRSAKEPIALSLSFPDPDCYEEPAQRSIAAQLDLDLLIYGYEEILEGKTPLTAARELVAQRPFPLQNFWQPAYLELARRARERGCRFILSGNGGDEWLTVTPLLAADMWKRLELLDLMRFWNSLRRSYRLSTPRMTYNLLWLYGVRLVLADIAKTGLERLVPHPLERWRCQRARNQWKPWLSLDDEIFRPLVERALEKDRLDRTAAKESGYYLRELRTAVDHFLVAQELDETALLGRETGTLVRQPFMHPDLISFLIRVHPDVLSWKGRSKGLIRESVARRFPGLGFQSQRKVHSTGYYRRSLSRDLARTWCEMGGTPALDEQGILDPSGVDALATEIADGCQEHRKVHDLWSIINLETWLRAWV